MHKQMLIRHLELALKACERGTKMAIEKYGTNHLVTTTLTMEEKELRDYIDKLKVEEMKKGA